MTDFTFILVEPAVPGNVGSAARAIKTMGFSELVLVNPCDHLSVEARMLAHGANEILENARVVGSLAAATKGLGLVVGTTAKTSRSAKKDYYTPAEVVEHIVKNATAIVRAGIVFGREESGLSNDELRQCDVLSSIPLKTKFPSLNLAQSVMLYAYHCAQAHLETNVNSQPQSPEPVMERFRHQAIELLKDLDFKEDSNIYHRMMERLMMAGEDDVHLMLSFMARLQEKL
ncbi:MAG: tRNA/rRNA methyltransferase [Cyclobacteriaceae bacterium]